MSGWSAWDIVVIFGGGWFVLTSMVKAVGDWLIRWRLAGHAPCPQCSLEAANKR